MRRITLWACAALLTFSAGAACAFVWLLDAGPEVERLTPQDEPSDALFCHLVAAPEGYEGKLLRVRATYVTGRHGPTFVDRACLNFGAGIWVSVSPAVWRELGRAMEDAYGADMAGVLDVVAVGKFGWNRPSFASDSLADKAAYRFELLRVERAVRPR